MASSNELTSAVKHDAEPTATEDPIHAVFHTVSGQTITITLAISEADMLNRAIANGVKIINFNNGNLTVNFDNVEYIEYVTESPNMATIG